MNGPQEGKKTKRINLFENVDKILEKLHFYSGQCIVKQEVPGSSSASIHSRLVGPDIGTFVSQRTKPLHLSTPGYSYIHLIGTFASQSRAE